VLSAENLFGAFRDASIAHTQACLAEIADEIEVAVYLRNPVDLFVSAAQQRIKHFADLRRPTLAGWGPVLERLEAIATLPIAPRIFGREVLRNGDLVSDFAHTFLPEGAAEILLANRPEDSNVSISAEAMALVQTFNSNMGYTKAEAYVEPVAKRFRGALYRADRSVPGFAKPRCTPAIAAAIIRQDRSLTALRDRYGIVLPNVDYARAGHRTAWSKRRLAAIRHVRDFLVIDREREAQLAAALAEHTPVPLIAPHRKAYWSRVLRNK
jgi:hypothetical protein